MLKEKIKMYSVYLNAYGMVGLSKPIDYVQHLSKHGPPQSVPISPLFLTPSIHMSEKIMITISLKFVFEYLLLKLEKNIEM